MRLFLKPLSFLALLLCVGSALASPTTSATAVITDTPDASTAGVFDYTITLTNTGAPIGAFWFSWVPGGNFLTPGDLIDSSIVEPAGWTLVSDADSIRSEFSNAAGDPSSTLTFLFDSTETPAELLGTSTVASGAFAGTYPDLTSFVFASNSSVATTNPSTFEQITVTSDLTATPEPSSMVFTLTGVALVVAFRFKSMRDRRV